jgi:hypothetical protein
MKHAKKQTKNASKPTKGDARKTAKTAPVAVAPKETRTRERDPRIPATGTVLTRTYKGKDHRVTVLDEGFRYEGEEFRSLSALAMKITGYAAINGVSWFGLAERPADAQKPKQPKSKGKAPATTADAPAAAPAADAASV